LTCRSKATTATAARPITAAAIPSPTSKVLTLRTAGAGNREAGAGPGAPAGRLTGAPVLVGGRADGGAAEAGAAPAAVGGRIEGAPPTAPAGAGDPGPPAGNVGSLMVGDAAGLGGRLIRTVSFLG
jgi:hypothetical protein